MFAAFSLSACFSHKHAVLHGPPGVLHVHIYKYTCCVCVSVCVCQWRALGSSLVDCVFYEHHLFSARFHTVRVFALLPFHELSSLVFPDVRGFIAPPSPHSRFAPTAVFVLLWRRSLSGMCVGLGIPLFFVSGCVVAHDCVLLAVLYPPHVLRLDSSRRCKGLFQTSGLFRTGRQCVEYSLMMVSG